MQDDRLVDNLLEALQPGVAPDAIARAQADLLSARQGAPEAQLDADVARLIAALGEVERGFVARGIAALTGGALVESGTDPGPLGRALLEHLPRVLEPAAEFAASCIEAMDADSGEDQDVLDVGGASVPVPLVQAMAQAHPEPAVAWQALEYWALPTIACLTRSRALRDEAREAPDLRKLACDAVGQRGFLTTCLDLLDDDLLVVLHPSTTQGFEVIIRAVPGNFDLQILLADALVGEGRQRLPGARPDPAAVLATQGEGPPTRCEGVWDLYDARALASGALPDPVPSEYWVWNEGRPADIPEVQGQRVLVLGAPSYSRTWTAQPIFGGLRPELEVRRALSEAEVREWIGKLTCN